MKLRAVAALLALSLSSGCMVGAVSELIDPPYSPASIAAGRTIFVRPKSGPAVAIVKPVWVEEDGRAWIAGDVYVERNGVFHTQDPSRGEPGRVAVDEVKTMSMEPERGPEQISIASLGMLVLLVVLVIAAV